MNSQKQATFKFLLQMRLDRIRNDFDEGFIEQEEFSECISNLLGLIIEKASELGDTKELTRLFTVNEVILALGLEEQHEVQ